MPLWEKGLFIDGCIWDWCGNYNIGIMRVTTNDGSNFQQHFFALYVKLRSFFLIKWDSLVVSATTDSWHFLWRDFIVWRSESRGLVSVVVLGHCLNDSFIEEFQFPGMFWTELFWYWANLWEREEGKKQGFLSTEKTSKSSISHHP